MPPLPRRLQYGDGATVAEHLEELRWRLFIMLAALGLGSLVAFAFHTHVIDWLNRPLPADRRTPTTFEVTEPFVVTLTVSLYAGFVLALPAILWQVWAFLAPALEPNSPRRLRGLCVFAILLGASGLAFGYWVLLPRSVQWLTMYDDRQFHILIQAKPYYSFVSTVLLGIVLVFELPLLVLGLVYLRVLTAERLRRSRRVGYFLVAVVALGLPGPDPITTALELFPMWILFELSIWLAVLVDRRLLDRVAVTQA